MEVMIPARRRRYSGSMDKNHAHKLSTTTNGNWNLCFEPPPRPKSTPGERPHQRRRPNSPQRSSDPEQEVVMQTDPPSNPVVKGLDDEAPYKAAASSTESAEHPPSPKIPPADRPTKSLPTAKIRRIMMHTNLHAPMKTLTNPSMLPVQHQVAKGAQASKNRKLYVILEQACLEAYRISSGGNKGRNGKEGEFKYTLLNCDDHQGILAKTGRDIADARPDITHQVSHLTMLDGLTGRNPPSAS